MSNTWEKVGNSNNGEKNEVKYLKFKEGATSIRILDEAPRSRWTHWLKAPANGGKGMGIDCLGKDCPCCEINRNEIARGVDKKATSYPSKMSHAINVLVKNGTEKEVNVLEQGNGLFGNLKDCMTMLGSAGLTPDLRTINLLVNRTGKGFSDTKYTVMPMLNAILSLTDEEMTVEKYDLESIKPKLDKGQIILIMNGSSLEDVTKTEDTPVPNTEQITTQSGGFGVDFAEGLVY